MSTTSSPMTANLAQPPRSYISVPATDREGRPCHYRYTNGLRPDHYPPIGNFAPTDWHHR